jgi:glycosidase
MPHFHISSNAAITYQMTTFLEPENGRLSVTGFEESYKITEHLQSQFDPFQQMQMVKPWLINGHAVIHTLYHLLFKKLYEKDRNEIWQSFSEQLAEDITESEVNKTLQVFNSYFLFEKIQPEEISSFEEILYLWISNQNPALQVINMLISDHVLLPDSAYLQVVEEMKLLFSKLTPVGSSGMDFVNFLLEPIRQAPNDLLAQMEYMRKYWADILGADLLLLLLNSMDFIREQEKAWFSGGHHVEIPDYSSMAEEVENFTQDKNWMPRLVLVAKNIYVWLYQLSRTSNREITRLDQIPDETLQELAHRGISGLWLIGVWERSKASADIKQKCGNPEALASAYSLEDYRIADELGGEQAYSNLKDRAAHYGIRMGTDMVPNHMGLDSSWVKNHPEWFVSLDHPPYPSYSFNGPNLSKDPAFNIQIEDHYYDRTDAAVVYRFQNFHNGMTKYIYHGNDGTSMPWNDTAQLNYLDPNVREAVIQTILYVARLSPIIRFDAAMILTKRHYQRLWYPAPGHGGDIPSRAGRGLSDEEFHQHMPVEFWREVVDRIAQELPDTLLLAEAFWLMESYFVRTLGMHRVYNSAFMHLLRDENNTEFLKLIRNTLEYNPEILKRYVNFMNNPDEETAVQQFGKDDKYFGVCTMLATFPGLPMIGHGQIEGFSEKYGMEYRRAYHDEQPDQYFIDRHEREIFPLLKRRYQFSEVANFYMYDFVTTNGYTNQHVYAYSNLVADQRSLVLYHNKFEETTGWVKQSWDISGNSKSLAEALELPCDEHSFVIFREHIAGLWYIRKCKAVHEQGLFISLGAFKYQVFVDFQAVPNDESGFYQRLHDHLDGKGTESIEEHAIELFISALSDCAKLNPVFILDLGIARLQGYPSIEPTKPFADKIIKTWQDELSLAYEISAFTLPKVNEWKQWLMTLDSQYKKNVVYPLSEMPLEGLLTLSILTVHIIFPILQNLQKQQGSQVAISAYGKPLLHLLSEYYLEDEQKKYLVMFQLFLMEWAASLEQLNQDHVDIHWPAFFLNKIQEPTIKRLLQVNEYEGIAWFNREMYFIYALSGKIFQMISNTTDSKENKTDLNLQTLLQFADPSQYQFERLLHLINEYKAASASS